MRRSFHSVYENPTFPFIFYRELWSKSAQTTLRMVKM